MLALDLERTLIDDARSGRPRPGLSEFLAFCDDRFERVVLYTTVEEADARDVLSELTDRGYVPATLLDRWEFVEWTGTYKDLEFVPRATGADVRLVDDDGGWVRLDQRENWIPIAAWDGGPDTELVRVRAVLQAWITDG